MAGFTMFEPVRSRFSALVADMSPRDRSLFLGLVIAAYLGALGVTAWGGKSLLSDVQSRISTKQTALTRLESMQSEYAANSARVVEIEDTLRTNANQDLASYVEKAAQKVGVGTNLKAVREKGVSTQGNLEEKSYTVDIDKVTLTQLTDFLFEIETNGFPMRIRTSRVKTSGAAGARLLSATFEISAFRLDESTAIPAPEGGK